MKSTLVFATAQSRLHADIMMIRLRRAGININSVSAIFSRCFAPNTFFFWLRRPRALLSSVLKKDDTFFVAGPIQRLFGRNEDIERLPAKLRDLGLDRAASAHIGEALRGGHGMLCVRAKNKDEVTVALRIFEQSKAENISVAGLVTDMSKHHQHTAPTSTTAWQPAFAA